MSDENMLIRDGYWDERLNLGSEVLYAYRLIPRYIIKLIYGAETKLPKAKSDE